MNVVRGELEHEVSNSLLLGIWEDDQWEFSMEFDRVGLKFIRDRIDLEDREQFTTAFDELVRQGCLPATLARTIYCYHKSQIDSHNIPTNPAIRDLEGTLQAALNGIRWLEDCDVMDVFAKHAGCGAAPRGRKEVTKVLRWYISSLAIWQVPRKDIINSYAPFACCIYPKIATGKFHFSRVYDLLECLGYKPSPKRQRNSSPHLQGYSPASDSLERNFRNFRKSYSMFCETLEMDLRGYHRTEEAGLPINDLNRMLRPNPFDWEAVFGSVSPRSALRQVLGLKRGKN
jgi:hypothetical protein